MATGTIQKLMPTDIGVVRPNLLDNWYFVGGGSQQGAGYFPINSNGQTSYTTIGQTIGRWDNFISDVTTTVQSDSIKISDVSGHNGWIAFAQDYIAPTALKGKTVTLSALCGAITGDGFNFIIRLANGSTNVATYSVACVANSLVSFTKQITDATFDRLIVAVQHGTGAAATSTIELKAAKLELGDSQTLAHQENGAWVLNEVPNYEVEFYKSGAVDTAYVLDTAYCSKVGKVCVLTFDSSSTITTGNADTWKALVTLPSKYRPALRTYGVVGGGGYNSTYYCTVRIETTGVVSVSCHQAANVAYLTGQITYFTS